MIGGDSVPAPRDVPYVREAGAGAGVVCLHANASSSAQWRGLSDRLAPMFCVFAPDLYGSGRSPDWPMEEMVGLSDEAAFIEPVLAAAGSPLMLVGHSYGGAAALVIDYWMGTGAWDRTPEQRKPTIAASIANVRRWGHALFTEPTPLESFASLDVPVLCLTGRRSTPAAHGVTRLLSGALPRVQVQVFEELGHMGPVTHPELVNESIADFLTGSM